MFRGALKRVSQPLCAQTRQFASGRGLFGIEGLHQPQDWRVLAARTKKNCNALVTEAIAATGAETIRKTDELSDTICKVFDAAELCRNVHSKAQWREEAQRLCINLGGLLASLNVNPELYHAVAAAAADPSLPPAVQRVGRMLCEDFRRNGVQLQGPDQQCYLAAVAREQMLCMQFGHNLASMSTWKFAYTSVSALDRLSSRSRRHILQQGRNFLIRHSEELMTHENDLIRKQVWAASKSSPEENLPVIEELTSVRLDIASMLGAPSYAHHQASHDTVAQHPAAISHFLKQASKAVCDKAAEELEHLQSTLRHSGKAANTPFSPWDVYFAKSKAMEASSQDGSRAGILTIAQCMEKVGEICSRLFGVHLLPVELASGEGWSENVQKLALSDSDRVLGHLYLDLFRRPGKMGGLGTQYTLVNGRRLPDGSYQKPLVALVCNFSGSLQSELDGNAMHTFFHEFGHVLHALLTTTEFQHVAGTRGSSDCIELPSQLFERFAFDCRFGTAGRSTAAKMQRHGDRHRMFCAMNVQQQVFNSSLDLRLHGEKRLSQADISDIVAELSAQTMAVPFGPGANPQARFNHLAAQPAKYYTYAYSKCFAEELWRQRLNADPLNASAGQHVKERLLAVGMSEDPSHMIGNLIGRGAIIPHPGGGFHPRTEGLLEKLTAI